VQIVIIEDNAAVAHTLKLYLEQAGFEPVVARDGVRGLEMACGKDVVLVILDLMIPGMSGQEVCKRLRQKSTVPIIMVTARVSEDDRVSGLDLGADDYVTKPFHPREVVARVQALMRRTPPQPSAPPPPVVIGELEINRWGRSVYLRGQPILLTPTEFRLLEVLARSPGRVFTREELLARTLGPDFDGTDRTIDVHITNLRRKIEKNGKQRYVVTVHGIGYRLGDVR
jgi:two-component system alkaline phosphatase synthesis response regulator PhoP